MNDTIIKLRDEVSEAVKYLMAILETIDRGTYGISEALFDLDNLNLGAITLLMQEIAETGDPR